ncbi:MAG: hypothetical protein NTX38_19305, partial [Methylobacter sp.]|nr:hypothetical protein [Methylobacter sp.]
LLASVAVRETAELGFQTRYEQTKERLDMIKQAILGNPKRIINGQQAVSGFVADMGRLPNSLRELVQRSGDCSDNAGDVSETECLNLATPGTWTANAWNNNSVSKVDSSTKLQYGWNGPYLNISGSPADNDALTDGWGRLAQGYCTNIIYTDETACTTNGAVWIAPSDDHNFGWYYDALTNASNLIFFSYGKDQIYTNNGTDYDADYPAFASQPAVKSQDWLLDVSNGISVSFIKSTRALPNISFCTDTSKTTKANCLAPATWYGGCSKASFYNVASCTTASGTWSPCSDGSASIKTTCLSTVGNVWYGNGFGCSVQSNINATQASCTSNSNTWYSCSDNTKTTLTACLAASETWYGNNLSSPYFTISNPVSPYTYIPICMKVFYRKTDSSIGVLVSDGDTGNDVEGGTGSGVNFDPNNIIVDVPSSQTIKFSGFRDSAPPYALITNSGLQIPSGNNAIGIYQYDGTSCSTTTILYPTDRLNPIQVDFHPNASLPVINW